MIKGKGWLGEVEGLRGLASLWVFAFHVGIACGTAFPIISSGGRGVDLFILISGFIMVHQFLQREDVEPWNDTATFWRFWIRRFFRIAPLYYPLLILSLLFHRVSDGARDAIVLHFPSPMMARHSSPSTFNFLSHLTFIFGALPHFASATPLPDWSIGLEVQFYFVFPFLMLFILKFGHRKTIFAVSAVPMTAALLVPIYFGSFTMPAFLPLRMYLFGMGMLIAAKMHSATGRIWPLLIVLPIAAHFTIPGVNVKLAVAQIFLALFLYLVTTNNGPNCERFVVPIRRFLSGEILQKLGLLSYSLYLMHLLVVIPLSALLLKHSRFSMLSAITRFLISFSVDCCVVLPLAMLLYTFLEKPGVRFGKRLVDRLLPRGERIPAAVQHT
jgi:peptidoglycan/LPS O-acetylase OafA/YrhL